MDPAAIITKFTPLVLQLIAEFRHRSDEPIASEIEQRLQAIYLQAKHKGDDWFAAHPGR